MKNLTLTLMMKLPSNSREIRRRILMICKQSYWNQFEQGLINRNAAKYLRTLADLAMDADCRLLEWEWILGTLQVEQAGEAIEEAATVALPAPLTRPHWLSSSGRYRMPLSSSVAMWLGGRSPLTRSA